MTAKDIQGKAYKRPEGRPLNDKAVLACRAEEKPYAVLDSRGLYLEVSPVGGKSWRVRYQFNGKTEKLTLGQYPALSLKDARLMRDGALTMAAKGHSPAQQKKADKSDTSAKMTFEEFAEVFMREVQAKDRKDNAQILRYLKKDIYPFIGKKTVRDITTEDIRAIIWKKKDHGFDSAANLLRTILKKIFDYALTKGVTPFNPVLALPTRHIFKPKSRDRYLTPAEIGVFLRTVYASNIRRQFKVALHLCLLTMVRKGELFFAEWKDIDLDKGEWLIPQENSKTGAQHIVYLPEQAIVLFNELKALAGGSHLVLPGRASLDKPFAHNAVNYALKRSMAGTDLVAFTIHDLRRTAATLLSEAGWSSDVIDKALNHRLKGTRAAYIKSEHIDQRREMLSVWANTLQGHLGSGNVILFSVA